MYFRKFHYKSKYKLLNDNLFKIEEIDERSSYLLGLIASDGHFSKNGKYSEISLQVGDLELLDSIAKYLNIEVKISESRARLSIHSKTISEDARDLLYLPYGGKKSHIVKFPNILHEEHKWHFMRGYMDGDGHISNYLNNERFRVYIFSNSIDMINSIDEFTENSGKRYKNNQLLFYGKECMNFLDNIYKNHQNSFFLKRKYEKYMLWKNNKTKFRKSKKC